MLPAPRSFRLAMSAAVRPNPLAPPCLGIGTEAARTVSSIADIPPLAFRRNWQKRSPCDDHARQSAGWPSSCPRPPRALHQLAVHPNSLEKSPEIATEALA